MLQNIVLVILSKKFEMDYQFNTPEILSYLNSLHILYTFAPPYDHEFIGRVERMNRTFQDKITFSLKISVNQSKNGCLPYRMSLRN